MKLYTFKDIKKAFPWLHGLTVNYWVKKGKVTPSHVSTGTGIPNMWTKEEALRLAMFSILVKTGYSPKALWGCIEPVDSVERSVRGIYMAIGEYVAEIGSVTVFTGNLVKMWEDVHGEG